jgi:acyl carrier protein
VSDNVKKIKQIIAEKLGVSEEKVKPQASFIDDLGADSLDAVEIIMAIEDAFGIEIHDEDAEKLRTLQQVVEYLKGRT